MKKTLLFAIAAAGAAMVAAPQADARQGCGTGYHRTPRGHCVMNRNWHRGGRTTLVIGNYYPNQGYWDGRRYWQHRYRWHNGWRYR